MGASNRGSRWGCTRVGILNKDYLSGGGLKSRPEGSTFALVYPMFENAYVGCCSARAFAMFTESS